MSTSLPSIGRFSQAAGTVADLRRRASQMRRRSGSNTSARRGSSVGSQGSHQSNQSEGLQTPQETDLDAEHGVGNSPQTSSPQGTTPTVPHLPPTTSPRQRGHSNASTPRRASVQSGSLTPRSNQATPRSGGLTPRAPGGSGTSMKKSPRRSVVHIDEGLEDVGSFLISNEDGGHPTAGGAESGTDSPLQTELTMEPVRRIDPKELDEEAFKVYTASMVAMISAKKRFETISESMSPADLKGLTVLKKAPSSISTVCLTVCAAMGIKPKKAGWEGILPHLTERWIDKMHHLDVDKIRSEIRVAFLQRCEELPSDSAVASASITALKLKQWSCFLSNYFHAKDAVEQLLTHPEDKCELQQIPSFSLNPADGRPEGLDGSAPPSARDTPVGDE